jgi:hypothetical protein
LQVGEVALILDRVIPAAAAHGVLNSGKLVFDTEKRLWLDLRSLILSAEHSDEDF